MTATMQSPGLIALGSIPLQWYRKISFTDVASETRYTFKTGDFIKTQIGIMQLGFIFVHQLSSGTRRAFARVTKVRYLDGEEERDSVLDLLLLQFSGEESIVGLPSINPEKLWVVPVEASGPREGARLIYCE